MQERERESGPRGECRRYFWTSLSKGRQRTIVKRSRDDLVYNFEALDCLTELEGEVVGVIFELDQESHRGKSAQYLVEGGYLKALIALGIALAIGFEMIAGVQSPECF